MKKTMTEKLRNKDELCKEAKKDTMYYTSSRHRRFRNFFQIIMPYNNIVKILVHIEPPILYLYWA